MKTPFNNIIATLAIVVAFASCSKSRPGVHLQIGESMPDFITYTIDGLNVGKETLVGKPSIVALFDTRCPDCKAELPEIEKTYRSFREEINVVAIAREENASMVKSFWDGCGYMMPVAAPGKRDIYNLFDRNSMSGIPQVYIFDKAGVVVEYYDDKNLFNFDNFVEEHAAELLLEK